MISATGYDGFPRTLHGALSLKFCMWIRCSTVFMYVSSAPPDKWSLSATNGTAQMMVLVQRTIGPAAAPLVTFSLDNNIFGGKLHTYVVLLVIV